MRTKLIILFCFLSLLTKAQTPVDTAAYSFTPITVVTKHYITSWSQFGSFDTCIVKGGTNLGGAYIKKTGDSLHRKVLINEGPGIVSINGLEVDDCSWLEINGHGSTDTFGIVMDASHNGFAMPLEGKTHHINIIGVQINGGINEGITAKIEAPDLQFKYHCDMSYASFIQNHITIKFCKFRYNGGEAVYVNSTGWYGRDPVTCPVGVGGSDSTWLYKTAKSAYITIDSNIFIGAGRSDVNYSNSHVVSFVGNKSNKCGRELNKAQGKVLADGGAVDSSTVTDNKSFGSFHNAFWFASEGVVDFERNVWDSAGWYGTTKNTDQTPGVVFGVTVGRTVPVTWKICNNTGTHANNGVELALYPGPQNTTTGNYFGGNTGAYVIDKTYPFIYSNNCASSNLPPVVNAGNDTTITQPATTINLIGTATDADGTIASHNWVNGDGCIITSSTSYTTTATCAATGNHTFILFATDNSGAQSSDYITATVNAAANIAPVAVPQNDTIVYEPIDTLVIHQNGTDADGTVTDYNTFLISTYYGASVKNITSQNPTIIGLASGDSIVVQLKVLDDKGTSNTNIARTTIIVRSNPSNNPPVPIINKDTSDVVRLPVGQISIDASGSYDPDKGDYVASYRWVQVAGDTNIIMTGINASVLTLDGLDTGTYKFRLTVTDTHGASSTLNFSIKAQMQLRFKIIRGKQKTSSFKPIYGSLWANYSATQKVQASELFGMKENRVAVNFLSWNGVNSPITDQLIDSGQLVSLNIHEANYSDTSHFSNVNLVTYASRVNTLLDNVNSDSVVIVQGNEADAIAYHAINDSTDLAPNITMASIVARAALARGIQSANGGLTSEGTVYATYRFLSNTHDPDTTNFLHYCIPVNRWAQVINRSNPDVEAKISNYIYLIRRYDTIPFTQARTHMYFPFAKRMNDTATNWRADYTGIEQVKKMLNYFLHDRQIGTDEFGFVIPDAAVANYVVLDLKKFGFTHQDYWNDPTSTNVSAISNASVLLTTLGNSYKSFIQ
jgi:hypothetical protein